MKKYISSVIYHHFSKGHFGFAILLICYQCFMSSCNKFVDPGAPFTSINGGNVYENNTTAIGALNAIYSKMSGANMLLGGSLTVLSVNAGLSADEFQVYSGITNQNIYAAYQNKLSSQILGLIDFYSNCYSNIYTVNAAIEGLNQSESLTPAVQQQLLGEAKFMRAFFYFYLVNLYGDVPLITTIDYTVNATINRTPKDQVWTLIKNDLKEAETLLKNNFPDKSLTGTTTERIRPTSWAAAALLARTYLYTNDYPNAEAEATKVIANTTLFNMIPLNQAFKKNNQEAIWQLQPVNTGWNTEDARVFIIPSTGPSGSYPVSLSTFLLSSFDSSDQRKSAWTNSITIGSVKYDYPYKYQSAKINDPVTEYNNVLRLAEQYLIRSEARIQNGKTDGGLADLNVIRKRAGLSDYTGPQDKQSILDAILHERQVELFSEWGHRWLDLKRTGKVDAVMSVVTPLKGGTWSTNWQLYPISQTEILKIPGMANNSGY